MTSGVTNIILSQIKYMTNFFVIDLALAVTSLVTFLVVTKNVAYFYSYYFFLKN